MQKSIILFIILLITPSILPAQFDETLNRANIPVTVEDQLLLNPWVGGLNSPQFSVADLNGDGISDLYVFDRANQLHLTWLWTVEGYVFTPELAENFPLARHFVLLRDYDGDGISDMFVQGYQLSVTAWKGAFLEGKLTFEPYPSNPLSFSFDMSESESIQVLPANLPDLNDIDGDGDLDILTAGGEEGYTKYYKNQSIELGYATDSLVFTLDDQCWGKFFFHGIFGQVGLSTNPEQCYTGFAGNTSAHEEVSLTSRDMNGDGARELFLSNGTASELILLENGGTSEGAWMNGLDETFPVYDTPVEIDHGQAVFNGDFDNDGLTDLMVSSQREEHSTYDCAWFYKNTGTEDNPLFSLQQTDFLTETMLDFGFNSHPAVVDVNGDGLLDLVIGTNGRNSDFNDKLSRLVLLINTGTTTAPAFTLADDDWLNFSQFSILAEELPLSFSPTFGDLDSDGDLDLFVGEYFGTLFYAENTGNPNGSLQYNEIIPEWKDLDVGLNSVPQILDLDNDGLKDIIIGERNGNVNFMKNIGTATEPLFAVEENDAPNINVLGEVDAAGPGEGFGHSAPRFLKKDGEWLLYLGTRSSGIQLYDNINPDDLAAPFNLLSDTYGNVKEGQRVHAAFADFTDDGELEMIVGNQRGGLAVYSTPLISSLSEFEDELSPKIYPNPIQDILNVILPEYSYKQDYFIYNAIGQVVQKGSLNGMESQLVVKHLTTGIYFLKIDNDVLKFMRE